MRLGTHEDYEPEEDSESYDPNNRLTAGRLVPAEIKFTQKWAFNPTVRLRTITVYGR
jgi:hypothetical protein